MRIHSVCCSSSTGYGIRRVDGFIFLAYDCHIQVHYIDLNSSTYAKAIFIVGLCLAIGCSTLKTYLCSSQQSEYRLYVEVTHKSELHLPALWIILSMKYWEEICQRQSLFPKPFDLTRKWQDRRLAIFYLWKKHTHTQGNKWAPFPCRKYYFANSSILV